MTTGIRKLLEEMVERRASDLHLTSGVPPQLRIDGVLVSADRPPLSPEESRELSYAMIDEKRIARLESDKGLDTSISVEGLGRFRLNIYFQRGSVAAAVRHLPWEIPTLEELGVPAIMKDFCEKLNGLVLVSGPTGSGKSTTMASMLSYINEHKNVHILSIEDPIEMVVEDFNQVAVKTNIGITFASALRTILRQAPNVILVGRSETWRRRRSPSPRP